MTRKEELLKIINNDALYLPLVDQIMNIEKELVRIEKLPFYKVNPQNQEQQKMLPAFKIYKELLQQYTNCLKCLAKTSGIDDKQEESPLREWARSRQNAH